MISHSSRWTTELNLRPHGVIGVPQWCRLLSSPNDSTCGLVEKMPPADWANVHGRTNPDR